MAWGKKVAVGAGIYGVVAYLAKWWPFKRAEEFVPVPTPGRGPRPMPRGVPARPRPMVLRKAPGRGVTVKPDTRSIEPITPLAPGEQIVKGVADHINTAILSAMNSLRQAGIPYSRVAAARTNNGQPAIVVFTGSDGIERAGQVLPDKIGTVHVSVEEVQ